MVTLRFPGGLIREAVSKVRSVLPGHREDECDPPSSPQLCVDPDDPSMQGLQQQQQPQPQSQQSQQQQQQQQQLSFVEAVREAAAAAASEVALDVAGAKAEGRRLAEKVRDAMPIGDDSGSGGGGGAGGGEGDGGGIDGVWGEALGGGGGAVEGESGGPPGVADAKIDGIWDAALTPEAVGDDVPVKAVVEGVSLEGGEGVGRGEVRVAVGGEEDWARSGGGSSRVVYAGQSDEDAGGGAFRGGTVDAERGETSLGGDRSSRAVWPEDGAGLDVVDGSSREDEEEEEEGEGEEGGVVAETEREMISSEYASMEAGVLRAWNGSLSASPAVSAGEEGVPPGIPATASVAPAVPPAVPPGGVSVGVADEEVLRLEEPSVEAATVGELPTGVSVEAVAGNGTDFQQVGGVGVAGWGGGGEGSEGRTDRAEKEEEEVEVEEEKEPEWRVKMQELYANFQSG